MYYSLVPPAYPYFPASPYPYPSYPSYEAYGRPMMAWFGQIIATLRYVGDKAIAGMRLCVRELLMLWMTWIMETCIILGCLVLLYLTRTGWEAAHNIVHKAPPAWQQSISGSLLHAFVTWATLVLESSVLTAFTLVAQTVILMLLIHGTRVPAYLLTRFLGKHMVAKRAVVAASTCTLMYLIVSYYFGAENLYARGFAVRRSGLYDAASANDAGRVAALATGGREELGWPFRYTALHEASRKGHTAVVRMLADAGHDVQSVNIFGDTALFMASCNGHADTIGELLHRGADPNVRNSFADSALMCASYHGHAGIVQQLLDAGAAVDRSNVYGDTAASMAARRGHSHVLSRLQALTPSRRMSVMLVLAGVNVADVATRPLRWAWRPLGRVIRPALRPLRWMRRLPGVRGVLGVIGRRSSHQKKFVFRLYLDGSDLEGPCKVLQHNTWFEILGYSQVGCMDVYCDRCAAAVPYVHHLVLSWGFWFWEQCDSDLRYLMDSRTKSDKASICREAAVLVCWFGLAAYGLLCDLSDLITNWHPTGGQQRALYLAAKNPELDELDRLHEVQRLLDQGVSPDVYRDPREYGATALISAVVHGHEEVVRALLEAGADVNLSDDLGRPALMHAALHAQPEVALVLLNAGAQMDAQDLHRRTAIMLCFSRFFVGFVWDVDFANRNRQVARLLLETGADVSLNDLLGVSALMYSWINTQFEVLLDWLLPHHLYHVAMHNMLWEHAISTTAAAAMRPAAAPAA